MAKKKKKPCEATKAGRACIHQFADLCLAFSFPCWNPILQKPMLGFTQRESVSLYDCLEKKHKCPNTGMVFYGSFSAADTPLVDSPHRHNLYRAGNAYRESKVVKDGVAGTPSLGL